jgi:hypothetical protein
MTVRSENRSFRRPLTALALVVPLTLAATACGDDDDSTTTGQSGNGGGDSEMTVDIASPSDADDVEVPFDVQVDSSVELGDTDTGLHHVHLYYDGRSDDQADYDVVYDDSFTVERDLGEGEHTVEAVIANADHSLTDASAEITVNVTGEGAGAGDGGSDTTDPYGY